MKFISTRTAERRTSAEALFGNEGAGGGLFVPEVLPELTQKSLFELMPLSFEERMARVLAMFADDIPADLTKIAKDAFCSFDDAPASVLKTEEGLYVVELFHGGSGRAEDISLAIYARLIAVVKKNALLAYAGRPLAARSLLEAARGVDGVYAIAFYPSEGDELKTRAACVEGDNVRAVAVDGDCSKRRLLDALKGLESEATVVVADSCAFLRLVPYIACFVSAYCDLVQSEEIEAGDEIDFAVPCGELALATAGVYARKMGLPIRNLILAGNANHATIDLLNSGEFELPSCVYDTAEEDFDVYIPENLERLLFELSGRDCGLVREAMAAIKCGGFSMPADSLDTDGIIADWADEEDVKEALFNAFDLDDCLLDVHSATTASVQGAYCEDDVPAVIMATHSPYLNARAVLGALNCKEKDSLKAASKLEAVTAMEPPSWLGSIVGSEAPKQTIVPSAWMGNAISAFLEEAGLK